MAKRKFATDDPFGNSEDKNSWLQVDRQVYGKSDLLGDIATADAQVERVKRIGIFEIHPDLSQPRRAVPSIIRERWDGTAAGIADLLMLWWGATQDERGTPFDLGAYLEGDETERSNESTAHKGSEFKPGPIEASFLTIIGLAASIRRDGLTNPITVARSERGYQLETGERRWLAYHLLHAWFDGHEGRPDEKDTWAKIPAREVDRVDVWRQANENNARANLNAIARARQWSVLMMDLHGREKFKPYNAFSNEREYYAQVADLNAPYGTGEQLLNAMGVSSRSALTRYRTILRLADEIWQGGDDLNLSEEMLYDLARLPHDEAIQQYRRIVLGRNNVEPQPANAVTEEPIEFDTNPYAPGTKRHFSRLAKAIAKAAPGKHKHNALALKSLRELRQWLDEQEERIMHFMD